MQPSTGATFVDEAKTVRPERRGCLDSAPMFAHITPLEAPIVWFAFAAGLAVGAFATWFLLHKRTVRN